mgnify:CR=1 FL=1
MSFPAVVVLIFVFLLSGIVIMRPFLEDMDGESLPQEVYPELDSLLAEKERLLSAIEELDRDHQLSRISDDDYSNSRERLVHQTARVFQKLDQIQLPVEKTTPGTEIIDKELAGYIESGWKEIDLAGERTCASCGSQVAENDRFCRNCGTELPH